jgi:hypothetical membrane protein
MIFKLVIVLPEKTSWLKLAGVAGILTPVSAFLFIGLAIASYGQFSWTLNALSDLGVVSGVTAPLFNFGLFLSSVLALNFSIGLFISLRESTIGKAGVGVFILACISLLGISLFPENMRPFHYAFSVAFFVLLPIALLVIVGYYLKMRRKGMAAFTLLVAIIAAVPWVLQFTVPFVSGVAIPEAISAAAGSVWTLVLSYKMLKQATQARSS